ncbi:MAG: hypothetical protein H0T41_03510, partial [Rhodobacteraceae bacterium]|nr:hypothetical protein [Paracoccaceae bacterium]
MITPDLAPAGPSPVAIRAAGKAEASGGDADGKAEAPTLERAFAAFVEAEPLAPETSALPEALDPLAVLEGAAPPVPPTPSVATLIVAMVTPAAATTIAVAPEAESAEHAPVIGQRVPRAAAGSDATTPAPRPVA